MLLLFNAMLFLPRRSIPWLVMLWFIQDVKHPLVFRIHAFWHTEHRNSRCWLPLPHVTEHELHSLHEPTVIFKKDFFQARWTWDQTRPVLIFHHYYVLCLLESFSSDSLKSSWLVYYKFRPFGAIPETCLSLRWLSKTSAFTVLQATGK